MVRVLRRTIVFNVVDCVYLDAEDSFSDSRGPRLQPSNVLFDKLGEGA